MLLKITLGIFGFVIGIFGLIIGICVGTFLIIKIAKAIRKFISAYKTMHKRDSTKIKFKSFVKFYTINPKLWHVYSDRLMFTPPRDKTVYFRFSFVDYIKYRVYFWQKERNEETRNLQEKDAENMKILMRTMNEEVKIFREENERQIEEKLKSLLTDEDYKFLMSHKKEDAIKKAVDDLPVLEIEELKM